MKPIEPTPATRIGFVGAGSMGGPMVRRLLRAGVAVHLYVRRLEARREFESAGAVLEPSIGAVAEAAELLIVCPFSEAQLDVIATGPDGLLAHATAGSVLVQHATVSAAGIRRLATQAATVGVTILDAPVSGRVEEIHAGALTVLVGGSPEEVEQAEPLLRCYARTVIHTGDVGSATLVKLVNNLTFAANVQVAGAALDLGRQLGVRPTELLAALTACSANSFALSALRAVGDVEAFAERTAPYLRKDVALAEEVASAVGIDTGQLGDVIRSGRFDLSAG
jgi:3-hydroxyisobutyrate dehydrogenase-like beta-hydroxyacid dehydrogenase